MPGFLAPFEAGVGAAAFRRGETGHVVFDQRRPLDLAPLRGHPVLGAARVQMLAAGTLLSIPLPPEMELALTRTTAGWQIDVRPGITAAQPIRVVPVESRLLLAATEVGAVRTMTDPESGAILLVGTQRRDGQAMPATRRWATFVTGQSWLGVVVEPLSDMLSMRPSAEGFLLAGGPDGLPVGDDPGMANPMAQAKALSRSFGFANETDATLQGLRRVQMIDAATAPALRRGPKRRTLAQTLISLGLAAEAHAVLGVAATDDPREAEAPETIGLTAVAAVLAGRLDEAGGLDDSRLGESDELKFWRAARTALRGENASVAADLAGTVSLLNAYPVAMQTRLLPAVVESLLLGERVMAARALLQRWRELPTLAYARALLQEADGQVDKALGALDALVVGPDRLLRAKAGLRATELRLARGELTPSAAAATLERLLFAWRGDARDFALRLRAAELHVRSGAWRPALAMLRDTEQLFPEQQDKLQARMRQSVAQLLEAPAMARMGALDLVALVDENAELMPDGEAGLDLAARLSERLTALDLPRRAEPLLRKLVGATPAGPVRARFGARLAALRLQEADAAGALAALGESAVEKLPMALVEERSLIAARARARLGDAKGAVAALVDLDSEAALRARVDILEAARDWPRAAQAMQAFVRRILPAEGKLDDSQQRSLLRLATLAAQAGDAELLTRLREQDLPRFSPGPVADLFRLLTSEGVQGVADLPRAGQELGLARALAADPGRR